MSDWRLVTEEEFAGKLRLELLLNPVYKRCVAVTGPGRSGAIASAYASHMLHIPFIPYGTKHHQANVGPLLIVDTARESGKTMRKAERKYTGVERVMLALYEEPPRVFFWYEAGKPERFRNFTTIEEIEHV